MNDFARGFLQAMLFLVTAAGTVALVGLMLERCP